MRIALRLVALLALCGMTVAAAPQIKTQAPGFYRYAVGDFTVTALYDGYFPIDPAGLEGLKPGLLPGLLARAFKEGGRKDPMAVNAYLVNTGDRLILVDTGAAQCLGSTMGHVPENFRAAGYRPEDVDTVLITHMHFDHVCGLVTAEGKPAYPNATVWAAEAEAAYWLDGKAEAAAFAGQKRFFKMARDAVAPYEAKGAFRRFKPGATLADGVKAISIAGHTPGQTAYLFESKGRFFLASGDIVHVHAVQFAHPEAWIISDVDAKEAVAVRTALLAKLAANRWATGGAHLPFPGIGHVRKEGEGFAFVPVDYSPILPQ